MSKKIFKQIVKEFWLPFILAATWTIITYNFFNTDKAGHPKKINDYITAFGSTFFFVSYFSGQFFRVKKQIGVEQNLTTVEGKIITLTETLEDKTNHLINYVTGGDSYFYYRIGQNLTPDFDFMLEAIYVGDYPINNLRIFFMGHDVNRVDSTWELRNINQAVVNRANQQIKLKFSATGEYRTNFVFGADNKSWVQLLELKREHLVVEVKSSVYLNSVEVLKETYNVQIIDWPADSRK